MIRPIINTYSAGGTSCYNKLWQNKKFGDISRGRIPLIPSFESAIFNYSKRSLGVGFD